MMNVNCKVIKCAHYILVLILTAGWHKIVVNRLYYACLLPGHQPEC